jgi:amino acid transporter
MEITAERGLARALSGWALAAAIANVIIGGGIFVLPAAMAQAAGAAAPLYYLACAAIMSAVGLCFAEAGSRVALSGGVASCVEVAFGRYCGFLTAAMLWFAAVLAAAGIAAAAADALGRLAPRFLDPAWRSGFIAALILTLAAVNLAGVRAGGGLASLIVVLKVAPLLLLVLAGALHPPAAQTAAARAAVAPTAATDIGRAMLLGMFAFMGMETALGVAGEVRRPARNIPLAIFGALAAVTVLYVAIQAAAQRLLGAALAGSAAPLVDAARRASPALAPLLAGGALASMAGYLAADVLAAPRILFGMARDGLLPRALARVAPRSHVPALAILVHAGAVILLALSGVFAELVILSTLATLVVYLLGSLAAVALQRRGVALAGPPLGFRHTGLAAALGGLATLWIAVHCTWREAAAVLAAGLLASLHFVVWTRHPGRRGRHAPDAAPAWRLSAGRDATGVQD